MDILNNIFLGLIILLIVGSCYTPIYFMIRKKQIPILKQLSWIALAGIIFVILFATILLNVIAGGLSFNPPYHHLNLVPFSWLFETWEMGFRAMMTQVISNMIMFVPFGFLLPVVFKFFGSLLKTTGFAFCFSFLIEVFQYFIGRSCDIDDLILNTLGAIIGYGIFLLFSKWFRDTNWWTQLLGQ